ncbi:MAG: sodium:solute symporter family protein [Candidatus Methanomethylicaceae archaeon]
MDITPFLIIVVYMIVLLGIGLLAGKKSLPTTADFFVANRSIGLIATFFGLQATWWSAFAFLGSCGYFYSYGTLYLTAFGWNVLFAVSSYVIGTRVWKVAKHFNFISPADLFEKYYQSKLVGLLVAIVMVVFTIPYLQIQLTGGAYLFEIATGGLVPYQYAAILFYAIIVIYTWSGGLRAIIWTDLLQGALLAVGLLGGGLVVSYAVVGGPSQLFQMMIENFPAWLTIGGPKPYNNYATWFSLFLITPLGALLGPQMLLKIFAAKSERIFRVNVPLLCLITFPYVGSLLAGWSGLFAFPNLTTPDRVFPMALITFTPMIFASFILAAGLAAAQSTADGQIHACSMLLTRDIYQKFLVKGRAERHYVYFGKIMLLVFAGIALVSTFLFPGYLVTIGAIALGGTLQLLPPILGIFFWKRSTKYGCAAGLIGGIIAVIVTNFVPGFISPLGLLAGVWGLLVNFILFVLVSIMTEPPPKEIIETYRSIVQSPSQ